MADSQPPLERMLKLSLAHYRNPDCSEEECHRFLTQEYIPKAVAIHKRHKLEMYSYHFSPSPMRDVLAGACAKLQNGWMVDDHDLTVEFYFRDIADLVVVATDPEFVALQSIEVPYVTKKGITATLGWAETYIQNQHIVNLGEDGLVPQYGSYAESSKVEIGL